MYVTRLGSRTAYDVSGVISTRTDTDTIAIDVDAPRRRRRRHRASVDQTTLNLALIVLYGAGEHGGHLAPGVGLRQLATGVDGHWTPRPALPAAGHSSGRLHGVGQDGPPRPPTTTQPCERRDTANGPAPKSTPSEEADLLPSTTTTPTPRSSVRRARHPCRVRAPAAA